MQTLPRGKQARVLVLVLVALLFSGIFWAGVRAASPIQDSGWSQNPVQGTVDKLYNDQGNLKVDYDFGIGTTDASSSSLGGYFNICACEVVTGDEIAAGYIKTSNCSNFGSTDRILLINLQGTHAGAYKILEVSKYENGKIYFAQPMTSSEASSFGTPGTEKIFFQGVPQYKNFNVDSDITWYPWKTGYPELSVSGVIAFIVKDTLTFSGGGINASGLGYEGGAGASGSSAAYQGESYTRPGQQSTASNDGGGGGGGSASLRQGASGGGGGYSQAGNAGATGCNTATPGCPSVGSGGGTYYNSNKINLGSGGGGGGKMSGTGGNGGRGGGAVIIFAKNIEGSGTIEAKGENGGAGTGGYGCGGAGGSGGYVNVTALSGTVAIDVSGGSGGAKGGASSKDGGGGGSGHSSTTINTNGPKYSSGTYTSNIFDITSEFPNGANWTNATITYTGTGTLVFSYKICKTADCSDKQSWTACTLDANGRCKSINQIGNYSQYKLDLAGDASVSSVKMEYKNSDETPPSVFKIDGAPSGWVNTKSGPSLSAKIVCQDNTACDTTSFKIKKSSAKITCTAVPAKGPIPSDYNEVPEQLDDGGYGIREITSQLWVCAAGSDTAGNFNYTKYPANFSIDNTDPAATILDQPSTTWSKSDISVRLNCTDTGGSGCNNMYYILTDTTADTSNNDCPGTLTGPLTAFPSTVSVSTNKSLCLKVTDKAGNKAAVATSSNYLVDKAPPTTTDDSSAAQTYGSTAKIKLTCSDALSGCNRTIYCRDDSGGSCVPSTSILNTEGGNDFDATVEVTCKSQTDKTCNRIVRYQSEDKAGNKGSVAQSNIIKIDISIPICTMTPLSTYTTSKSITVSWQANPGVIGGSPIASVKLQTCRDDCSSQDAFQDWDPTQTQTGTRTLTVADEDDGHKFYFQCNATDTKGSSSPPSSAVSTTIMLNAPAVLMEEPQNNTWINKTNVALRWSVDPSLESSVVNYSVYWKEGSSGNFQKWKVITDKATTAVFGANGDPKAMESNKTYTFKVTVADKAANTKDSDPVTVKVDTGRPNCTIDSSLAAYQTSGTFTVSWSGKDGESGVQDDKYMLWVKSGSGPWTLYKNLGTSKEMADMSEGVYKFICAAMDTAGNLGINSTEKNTTVDLNPPEITQITFNDSVDQGQNLTVKATVTDTIKVSSVVLSYDGTNITSTRNSTNANKSVWDVTWTISNLTTTGQKSFTITVGDINGNANSTDYEFLVKLCDSGTTRKCGACGSGTSTCENGNWTNCIGADPSLVKPEICNGIDDNCDSIIDNIGGSIDPQVTHCACTNQADDKIPDIQAQADDKCDGIDGNCNGRINEDGGCCTEGKTSDAECNKKGACKGAMKTCTDGKWTPCSKLPGQKDCNSNLDNDCNDIIDSQEAVCKVTCIDTDGDGYGSPASALCTYPEEDCDDNDATVYPNAPAVCGSTIKDNNCDNSTADEEAACQNSTCNNRKQDGNEEGVDCGGDCPACFVWGWLFLTAGGVVILLILAFVWLHFRRQGRELTWEELKKKWTPAD